MARETIRWPRRVEALNRARTRIRAHPARHRVAWWLLASVLIASVTIASIPTRETTPASAGSGLVPSPPSKTAQGSAETEADGAVLAPSALAGLPATPSGTRDRMELTVRRGDTLTDILRRAGLETAAVVRALAGNPDAQPLHTLLPGQRLHVERDGSRLIELLYQPDPGESLRLTYANDGYTLERETRHLETRLAYVSGTIRSSLFEDGQEAGLSDALIMRLVEIFGWDIDFALDLRTGDSFAVVYEEMYWQGQKVADGRILAAEFANQGRVLRAIGHRDAAGVTRYYTPQGESMRRQFLRTPVEFSRITSRYTQARFHPILQTWRAHRGVDYAAPSGTPVRATASGRVIELGWNGGYGKTVVLRHGNTYRTLYAHLSRYAPGLRVGSHVEQGQIIGYVGSTGLATGPHLHYEFLVNGEHRDPLRYNFPAAAPIPASERAEFERNADAWIAKLALISRNIKVASSE